MQNKLELSLLIDYYGAFLTDNQCEMLKLNCEEDFPLRKLQSRRAFRGRVCAMHCSAVKKSFSKWKKNSVLPQGTGG